MFSKKTRVLKEVIGYLVVAIVASIFAITIRIFIFEPFIVPSTSMSPTLLAGDKVIVNKLAYKLNPVKKGDLIVFHSPIEEGKNLVKRAIAVEGDEIRLTEDGEIYINNGLLAEPYLPSDYVVSYGNVTLVINENEMFGMGDNRNNSIDSRIYGPIPEEEIFGKVIFIYGPLSRFGKINY